MEQGTGSPFTPIGASSVVDQIIDALLRAIRNNQYPRGSRLPGELELTKEIGVSRNSLREAIRFLTAMGILEVKRGEGTFIASTVKPGLFDATLYGFLFESSSNQDIVELRQALDEICLKMGILKCTDEEIEDLSQRVEMMRASFQNGDLTKAAMEDYDFHMALLQCSRNPFLIRIVEGVYELFRPSIEKNIGTEELCGNAVEHHEDIVRCLRERNLEAVPETVSKSLSSWRTRSRRSRRDSTNKQSPHA